VSVVISQSDSVIIDTGLGVAVFSIQFNEERGLSDIDFGDGTWEDARGTVQNTLQELVVIVKGNGKDGMQTTLANFITEYRSTTQAVKAFQEQRDRELKQAIQDADKKRNDAIAENAQKTLDRDRKMNLKLLLATVVIGFLGLVVTALGVLEANRQLHGKFAARDDTKAVATATVHSH
jgi:hypothetical protein